MARRRVARLWRPARAVRNAGAGPRCEPASPELATHDARGNRIDEVRFDPSWHALLALLRGAGVHAQPFAQARPGAMAARIAGFFLHGQIESGTLCPVTMTFASIPVLSREPALFQRYRDALLSHEHDPRDAPLAQKTSAPIGMGMTEKQGGSDVRGNLTQALPIDGGGRGATYRLNGHKWFFSAPQSDAHLVLARTRDSDVPSCFLVPRYTGDGNRNAVLIQRLKDKLGNRSNASAEVEFFDALGTLVGEEGRGIPTILEMASLTRLDCVAGSAALMRAALVQAVHHVRHRCAFGRRLAEQPLMQALLAGLAVESEAATRLTLRLAAACEAPADDPVERGWRRIVVPAAKYLVCKRAIAFTAEAMEVLGGNGYIEDSVAARLYREAPVNSIWEGSGNVMCLDVLRALRHEPAAAEALLASWARDDDSGAVREAAATLASLGRAGADRAEAQAAGAAGLVARLAQAHLMRTQASPDAADAFSALHAPGLSARDGLAALPPGRAAALLAGCVAL
jgi:putative acyl-CoA dehydrogenase